LRYFQIADFVKEASDPNPYYILFSVLMSVKAIVYLLIVLNLLKDEQKKRAGDNYADIILRLAYVLNFYLFFVPVTDGLSTMFKCYGPHQLFPSKHYPYCEIPSRDVYFIITIIVLLVKISINIMHEVCDTEKKVKYAKKWSK